MPPVYDVHPETRLITVRFFDVFGPSDLADLRLRMHENRGCDSAFTALVDVREDDLRPLEGSHVRAAAMSPPRVARIGFVASPGLQYGIARMFGLQCSVPVTVFTDWEDALEWAGANDLRSPVACLVPALALRAIVPLACGTRF